MSEAPQHPITNLEESIGKTVGRQRMRNADRVQKMGQAIYRERGFTVCEKGVHRFRSHEEANEWMNQMAIRRALKASAATRS